MLCVCAAAAAAVLMHELPEGEADAEGHATRPQEVQSVAFDGHDLPVAELRSVLATRTGDQLDADKLAADRARLQTTLVARGFLDARVDPAQVMFDASGGAFVTYAIMPGAEFHVRGVRVVGAAERDTGIVTLAKGAVASADRVERARDALATRLRVRGKAAAVAVTLAPDTETASVDVVLSAN
ncbi:MAG TPA: POTRA domain-containing protein [Kofleriaceae bacterium]|nr:POTRA domain-containing protein [Kofleriaceae bacterium]